MNDSVFYFGCLNDRGHYLWEKLPSGHVKSINAKNSTVWGYKLDGGILGDKDWNFSSLDGWSALAIKDNSVDHRPGSHSTFVVHANLSAAQISVLARAQWPEVCKRNGFPENILDFIQSLPKENGL